MLHGDAIRHNLALKLPDRFGIFPIWEYAWFRVSAAATLYRDVRLAGFGLLGHFLGSGLWLANVGGPKHIANMLWMGVYMKWAE